MSSKILCLFFVVTGCWHSARCQKLSAGLSLGSLLTIEKGLYEIPYGLQVGPFIRFRPIEFAFVQVYCNKTIFKISDDRVKNYRMNTLGWRIGGTPFQKYPFNISFGGCYHYYKYTTNSVEYQGLVFLPELTDKRKMDGMEFAISYPIKKWLEIEINWQKEPFMLWYHPRNANYLTFQVSALLGLVKKEE